AAEALPVALPLSQRLQAVFASRVADLPARTRWVLLLAALDGSGDLRAVQAATARPNAMDSLAPAEQARIVHVDDRTSTLTFRHPLTRSAVIELSTGSDRHRAHRTLAAHLANHPERQAWHLAAAATAPDEQVAALLDQVAHRLARRGDATGTVTALLRAADLSSDRAARSRRLVAAAHAGLTMSREPGSAAQLLAAARGPDARPDESLQAAITTAYLLLNADGDIETAFQLVTSAIGPSQDLSRPATMPSSQRCTRSSAC